MPTLLDAAGARVPTRRFDGSSFLPVLLGHKSDHRRYVYAMHNNVPEGPPYPIRSVREARFRYIRNLTPERTYIEKHVMGVPAHNPYWQTWLFASADDPHAYAQVNRYMHRPAEELYDSEKDPFEQHNLADDPQYADVKARLSTELDRWMKAQKDPGAALDTIGQLTASRNAARGK